MQNLQTPGQLSKTLGITTATLRNYVQHFGQYLSDGAKKKTRKRFTPEDVQLLHYAKSLLDNGNTYQETLDLLETQPIEGEILEDFQPFEQDPEPAPIPETSAIQTAEFYEQFVKPMIDAKDETIEILRKENAWLRTPWYKKIFRDPPE